MIGIFDSGIGGLTVLKELLALMPELDYVYLGDTARTPYGTKARDTISRYSLECADFLVNKNVEILVVACNTASSFALESLRENYSIPIIGTIESASLLAVQTSKTKRVGVIGTEATINSGVYQNTLKGISAGIQVSAQACPLFVPLVEQGMFSGEIVDKVVELYLQEIKSQEVDTLILGCTHYPILKDAITKFLGKEIAIVECSKSIAAEVRNLSVSKSGAQGKREYCVTDGVDRFNKLSSLFLGVSNVEAVKVSLSEIIR